MNRRAAVQFATLALAAPAAVFAQPSRRFRVGCVYVADEVSLKPFHDAFLDGMRQRGYVNGRNLEVHARYAGGDTGRLPALVEEMIAVKPDVLLGIEQVAIVMRSKTSDIPIVLPSSSDPVAAGLARSLARPGGNVTGIAALGDQIVAKQVDLLADIVPRISRIALLNDPLAPAAARFEQVAQAAAAAKGAGLLPTVAQDPEGVRQAFAAIERERAQGVVIVATGRMNQLRQEIIDQAKRLRLPSISALPAAAWAEAGGLVSYATITLESYRYAAIFVDRILRGARPSDIPIEQPTKFELVVNLKTAREIGISIPQSILLRVDRVID